MTDVFDDRRDSRAADPGGPSTGVPVANAGTPPVASGDAVANARDDARVAASYDALDARGRDALARGRVSPEPPTAMGDPRWGVTAVLRPRPWSSALRRCVASCSDVLGPGHAVYDASGFHVTVRAIEGFRGLVDVADPAVAAYVDAIAPVVARTAPIAVTLAGIAATPSGLIVRGYAGAALPTLRQRLHERLASLPTRPPGPEMRRADVRTTAHATLAVYGGPVVDAPAVAAFVDAYRETPFGTWTCDALWLVAYRREPDAVALETLARLPFGATS